MCVCACEHAHTRTHPMTHNDGSVVVGGNCVLVVVLTVDHKLMPGMPQNRSGELCCSSQNRYRPSMMPLAVIIIMINTVSTVPTSAAPVCTLQQNMRAMAESSRVYD